MGFQLASILLNFFWAYVMHTRNQPYMSSFEYTDIMKRYKEEIKVIEALDREGPLRGVRESIARKRHVEGDIETVTKAGVNSIRAANNVGSKYLWNWNSVEAVLLMSCVLVSVFGIMFSSEYVKRGTTYYSLLTVLTMLVVIGSLVYFFLVVWSEVAVKIAPKALKYMQCKSWMEKNKKASHRHSSADFGFGDVHGRNTLSSNRASAKFEMQATNPLMNADVVAVEVKDDTMDNNMLDNLRDNVKLEQTVQRLIDENKKLKRQAALASSNSKGRVDVKKTKKKVGHARLLGIERGGDDPKETHSRNASESDIEIHVEMSPTSKANFKQAASKNNKGKKITSISPNDSDSEEDLI